MKEIELPVTTTFSFTIDTHALYNQTPQEIDGRLMVPLGTIDMADKAKDIEVVRRNGGKILYATTSIEKKLEQIISGYMFGLFLREHPERSFFENEILGSSNIGFSFKKELVKTLVNQNQFLKGKDKHELERKLSDIVKWRNAFAHGSLQYDNVHGNFLNYYSNGHKKIMLNDSFWDEVIQTFTECEKTLNDLCNQISQPYLDEIKNRQKAVQG